MTNSIMLKRFKEVGMGIYESKSYLSLLERGFLTVSEVSRIAGIPRSSAYDALEKLMAKGFCASLAGKTIKYTASDPSFLQDKITAKIEEEFGLEMKATSQNLNKKEKELIEKKRIVAENLKCLVREIKPLYKENRSNENPLDYIEIIKDSYQIHKKFIELIGKAKSDVLIFTKPPYTGSKKVLKEQTEKQSEPLRQGITIKSIYEIPADKEEFEWWYNDIDAAAKLGEKARVIEELPMKMAVFDERIVMLPLKDPLSTDTSFTAQVVEHTSLAKGLKILFETMWERADDYHVIKNLKM